MTVYTCSPLWPLLLLAGLLGLYLALSRQPRQTAVARVLTAASARATAPEPLRVVDPVDVHAAQAIAICNGQPQLELAGSKGTTR